MRSGRRRDCGDGNESAAWAQRRTRHGTKKNVETTIALQPAVSAPDRGRRPGRGAALEQLSHVVDAAVRDHAPDLVRVRDVRERVAVHLSLIHISEPTRLGMISY